MVTCAFGAQHVSSAIVARTERVIHFHAQWAQFLPTASDCSFPDIGHPASKRNQSENLARLDRALKRWEMANVIVLHHLDISQPIPSIEVPRTYEVELSASLFEAALTMRRRYGRYLALQWRTEVHAGAAVNYTGCARRAIEKATEVLRAHNLSRVYFASDVDQDGLPWSNSITYGTRGDVQQALHLIFSELRPLTWKSMPSPRGSAFDLAMVGTLDRVAVMAADYFVSGPKSCARGGTYTGSIARWRADRFQGQPANGSEKLGGVKHLINSMDLWEECP